ncbi:hypothetical protein [Azohydromonas caseinilytica]|uniref:Uncharacterized protein n=1 Tax=Azohydromonas caseinilytica TaxID=2728836 RepID=A0A848FDA2_9BURK|nr:hypothetical protein [Azohydromonas caseinilytica]NML15911.1 hypothetical protein [Azohydromonas caseinilytica]
MSATTTIRLRIAALSGLLLPAAVLADDHRGVPLLPAYRQECGSCHVAYPPGMLPAASWQRAAVKSRSNCAACHQRAEEGNFSERFIRIPR